MTPLEELLHSPRIQSALPALSLATVHDGGISFVHAAGIRGPHDPAPVDAHTVFEAASLTKPLVSLIALQLVDEGRLDLDVPLQDICGEYVPGDSRARSITAAHVLAHVSGLPNLVRTETPLKTYFAPGERFNYGSSAFAWLQRALETVTGQPLEDLAHARVFMPLRMTDSSLQWQERFETNHAQGQELDGQPVPMRRLATAQASWSLLTTATDYGRFVQAVLGERHSLSPSMHARWLTPVVQVREGVDDVLNPDAAQDPAVAWGLGWGLEPSQGCFFHWGNSPGFRAFVIGNLRTRDAVVWFANSARGLRLARLVLPLVMPGDHRALDWLQIDSTLEE
jgi:CubicO group peptidase (beta-lactamase class C family)